MRGSTVAAVAGLLLVVAVPAAVAPAATVRGSAVSAPPPKGLLLPTGLRLVEARAGTASTAYVWRATYAPANRVAALSRYAAALRKRGLDVVTGPGANLTFPFRRWQVFACADPGCAAPRGRLTVVVAIPGG